MSATLMNDGRGDALRSINYTQNTQKKKEFPKSTPALGFVLIQIYYTDFSIISFPP